MRTFHFHSELLLPTSIDRVFQFFSDARNLQQITPAWLDFRILDQGPIHLHEGALIEYRLRVHGVPLKWTTKIAAWEPPKRFVDVQLRGPYKLWEHEHIFERHGTDTLARDHVRYAVPGGWLVNKVFVRRDVERIFAFRQVQLKAVFSGQPR